MRRAAFLVVVLFACSFSASADVRAPDSFEEDYHPPILIDSPQWFGFEIKVGPYRPGQESTLQDVFGNDKGWMLNLELDITLLKLPYIGQLNAAGGWGWSAYEAKAPQENAEERSGEETKFVLYPLSALGVLRIDALARQTIIPLTFAGKLGYEWVRYKTTTGERTDASGFNKGLRWGAQAALELDFLDRDSARRLDDDNGINHTYVLFEYYQSKTEGTGDATYQFGLGAQF